TCSVYGASKTPGEMLNEESALNPVSLYALMKRKSEEAILQMQDDNFSPTILRMATLYGLSPRMRFDLVVNLFSAKAYIDKEISIFGGDQWRPNLHIKDAAGAYIKCLEAPIGVLKGQIFNVGSNQQNYQIKQIGEIIRKVIPDARVIMDKENVDRRDYKISFDKIKRVLKYETSNTIEGAVKEIGEAIKGKTIKDYTGSDYHNYKYLSEKEAQRTPE
ncbi:MAG: NAD-dependent epimerase/dehydratase family protein, partial [Dehalococcoidales bacterium]